MKVLIAGGTGLIGRAVSRNLAAEGHQVSILTRSAGTPTRTAADVTLVTWDGATPNGWETALASAEAIVNLAGESLADGVWTPERKRRIRDSRRRAGEAIVAAVSASDHRPSVLVQASAVGYYGPRGQETVSEAEGPGSDFLAQTCVEWEASTQPVEALGVRRVIVRTGIVLSKDGGALPRMEMPFRLFGGGPIGSGAQMMPWIHIDDEAAAIRFLIESAAASGPYNLAAPNPVTNAEFGSALGRALGRPSLVPKPAFAMRFLFGEMASVLLEGQRAVPTRLLDAGFRFRYPRLDEALSAIYR
jgi:uncharacterized protein